MSIRSAIRAALASVARLVLTPVELVVNGVRTILHVLQPARNRKERSSRPDVRAVDKALSEALVVYSRTLPPADATAFLKRVHELAVAGLELKGFGPKSARTRVATRLQTWTSSTPHSGSVRYAQDRLAVTSKRDGITLQ